MMPPLTAAVPDRDEAGPVKIPHAGRDLIRGSLPFPYE